MGRDDPSDAFERKQSIAGIFHRASSTYDRVGPGFFAYFGRQLVKHAALLQNAHVLDIACGRGAVLFPAADAVGMKGSVIGIDLADGMVKETSQEALQRGIGNVEVRQMDAEHLEFQDAEFDIILCGFALFFFPQLERALAECRRVLKPGGRIAVSTWGNKYDEDWDWVDALAQKYLPPVPKEEQSISSSDEPEFDTPNGIKRIVEEAGFGNVQVFSENADFVYATPEEYWKSLWSHGGRARLERIEKHGGPDALARYKEEWLEQMTIRKGVKDLRQSFEVLYTLGMKSV